MIDLHVHTSASDGTLSPAELVRQAKANGLTTLAITDHDTVAGVEEALAEGQNVGLEVIPGVEISVEVPKGEMHILGYYVDIQNQQLQKVLDDLQEYRNTRNPRIIKQSRGIPVLAHPGLLAVKEKNDVYKLVKELTNYGLQGIEAYYPRHTDDAVEVFLTIAKENGLIVAGGSDFHGANKPDIKLGLIGDDKPISDELAVPLRGATG